jgi:hypothetical protein
MFLQEPLKQLRVLLRAYLKLIKKSIRCSCEHFIGVIVLLRDHFGILDDSE